MIHDIIDSVVWPIIFYLTIRIYIMERKRKEKEDKKG